jgi:hypothetical protein
MGNKFEHRVVTHRHAKKSGSKNCDAFPPNRLRGSAQAATLQLAIIRRKSFLFSAAGRAAARPLPAGAAKRRKKSGVSSFYFV